MKKLTLLLSITMCLSLFAGCGSDGSGTASTTSNTPEGIFSTDDISFIDKNGESVYRIIRPEQVSMDETANAGYLFKQMKTSLNVNITNSLDTDDGTDTYEILVGDTNRPESSQAKQYMLETLGGRVEDFIICSIGKKIVINGVNSASLKKACEYFVENYLKKDGIGGGIKYLNKTAGDYREFTINGVSIGKFKLIRDNTTRSWLIQEEADKIVKLVTEEAGYIYELLNDSDTSESEYEINIGNTNRTHKPQSDYARDDYEILISGKKVYLMGGSTYAVQVAVTEFYNMLKSGAVTDADSKIGSYSSTLGGYDKSSYYRLVWGDDFDGDVLDSSKWKISELEHKGAQLVVNEKTFAIENGTLIMRGYKEGNTYIHCDAIQSTGKFRWHSGYLEMRARIPDVSGVYSSFWGNGSDPDNQSDLLEIDIFESLGAAHRQRANIHMWYKDGSHTSLDGKPVERDYILTEGTLFDQYHTIGLHWTDEKLTFYYDGNAYYSENAKPEYIDKYINIYAGFNIGWNDRKAPDDSTAYPLEYHIDYIRLFQVTGQSFIDNGQITFS